MRHATKDDTEKSEHLKQAINADEKTFSMHADDAKDEENKYDGRNVEMVAVKLREALSPNMMLLNQAQNDVINLAQNASAIAYAYDYYKYEESNVSLFRSSMSWLFITIFLILICSLPICLIIFVLTMLLFCLSIKLFGYYTIYVLSITLLPLLYILHNIGIYPVRILAFYSIFPLFLSIVFRDCILFSLQIRENIIKQIINSEEKKTNQCIKCNLLILKLLKLTVVLSNFAKNYKVFGQALFAYKPTGNISKVIGNEIKTEKFKNILQKCWFKFGEKDLTFSYKKSWKVYNVSERIMLTIMIICVVSYISIPSIYYIFIKLIKFNTYTHNITFIIDILQFILGTLINIITGYSIAIYTEVIFYRLYKYHFYMKCLAESITFNFIENKPSQPPFKRAHSDLTLKNLAKFTKDANTNAMAMDGLRGTRMNTKYWLDRDRDNEPSNVIITHRFERKLSGIAMTDPMDYDGMFDVAKNSDIARTEPWNDMDFNRSDSGLAMTDFLDFDELTREREKDLSELIVHKQSADMSQEDEKVIMDNIYLFIDENHIVWFENWCRIEYLASRYFENTKSWIFGIVFCIMIGIGIVIYNIFIQHDWFDANVITISCGLLFFLIVFVRLLLSSIRFSTLEKKHIGLIQNQHSLAINHNLYSHKTKMTETHQLKIYLVRESLSDMINHIRARSLSPKIAGVSLNVALVRLSVSAFLGLLTSAGTLYLRSR